MNQPHLRHRHVFAVLRWDADAQVPEHQVAVPKVFLSKDAADAEAARLNALNGAKGYRYLVQLSHLVESDEHPAADS